jgi:molecular chaperone GrpE
MTMSDQPNSERVAEEAGATETAAEAAAAQTSDYETLVKLMKENEELKDRALRAAAEMENLRRRTAREVQDARSYAVTNFARDMLTVSDNLRRALEAVSAEFRATGGSAAESLIEGVEMTERSMLSTLERHGVRKLEPEGERFDPNFHQAMFEIPNAELPANTVVQVVQPGYSIGERVLRPAMVGVSKGGPKTAAAGVEPGPPDELAEKDA